MRVLFQLRKDRIVAAGKYSRLNRADGVFEIQRAGEEPYSESTGNIDHRVALRKLVEYLQRNRHILAIDDILAVVHRIPHGGRAFGTTMRLNHDTAARLERLLRAHRSLPAAAQIARAALNQLPNAHHIGVVETGIYRDLPLEHHSLAAHPDLRRAFDDALRGDGMIHEAAYQAALRIVKADHPFRAVSVHVGPTVSVTALHAGRAVATGLGASASIPGLTGSGAIDPAALLSAAEALDTETWRVAELLAERSGIAAMTGKKTYAEIEAGARAGDARCVEALAVLSYRIAFVVAGMTAAIGVPEMLVFSGEGASFILIEDICRRLPSVQLGAKRSANTMLSSPRSQTRVAWVEQTSDEAMLELARPFLPKRGVLTSKKKPAKKAKRTPKSRSKKKQ
jgi:acetate kinase